MVFDFSDNKNRKLFEERGITFQDAIDAISEKGILKYFDHPNKEKYPNQKILVVEINNYTYCGGNCKSIEKLMFLSQRDKL